MKSPKESPLTVSFFLPEIPFIKKNAALYAEENSGYLFIRYSGEVEIQESFNPQAVTELLKLIPEMEYLYDEAGKKRHGIYNLPEVDPQKVVSFLNRFGVVGISDIELRNQVMTKRDLPSITGLTGLNLAHAKKLYAGKALSPESVERLNAIRNGEEVPYKLVLKILRDLARSFRLYINLTEDSNFMTKDIFVLNDKNRKRIVSAWRNFGGAFKDSEDPAHSKFNLNEEWTYKYPKNFSALDFAESSLSEFSQVINKNLSLLSKEVITTQEVKAFNRKNSGLEVALAVNLVQQFNDKKVKRVCVKCGSVFLPQRIKEENKYCSEGCSKSVRNRTYREKKKVSATQAESKKTTKARKEKK